MEEVETTPFVKLQWCRSVAQQPSAG